MGFGTIPREPFEWYNKIKREKDINENGEKERIMFWVGASGSVVVKALCNKPEGRWFDTR
jgi:hypothetical protein